jgi:hypothetical protein
MLLSKKKPSYCILVKIKFSDSKILGWNKSQKYLIWVHKFVFEYGIGTQDPQISIYLKLLALEQFFIPTLSMIWLQPFLFHGFINTNTMVTFKSFFYGSFLVNLMEIVWNDLYLLQDKTFFISKLGMMDALLNSCIWDICFIV